MRYDGSVATLRGRFGGVQSIEVLDHATGDIDEVSIASRGGHGGGDDGAIRRFLAEVRGDEEASNTIEDSLDPHLYAFASEEARLSGKTIELDRYRDELSSEK